MHTKHLKYLILLLLFNVSYAQDLFREIGTIEKETFGIPAVNLNLFGAVTVDNDGYVYYAANEGLIVNKGNYQKLVRYDNLISGHVPKDVTR